MKKERLTPEYILGNIVAVEGLLIDYEPNEDGIPALTQVHRFGDKVAAYIGTGPTTYLEPSRAINMGLALIQAGTEIEEGISFLDSKVGTIHS
jgi:hypothetical protein